MIRGVLFCILVSAISASGRSDVCGNSVAKQAWEGSPVHSEGVQLQRELEGYGLKVECMRRSTEEHLFDGQKGAAWIKTSFGTLEAWFLPANQTFGKLEIKETAAAHRRYVYSFSGLAHVPPTIDSSQPIAFVKHGSVLLEVWGNAKLAAKLRDDLSKPR